MIETPLGAQAHIVLESSSQAESPSESELLKMVTENKQPQETLVVSRPWIGSFSEGVLDESYAKVIGLTGKWGQRQYNLVSRIHALRLNVIWPEREPKAQTEAIELAEAIITSITPDQNAKEVDYFPGAGSESNEPIPAGIEVAMADGMVLEASTSVGKIQIEAGPQSKRSYTWEGATRSVIMNHRLGKRWYGSKGLYYPGPGNHWEDHNGIRRGVLEEGQQHFKSVQEFMAWLKERSYMPFVYTNGGLLVGWRKSLERNQLSVEVWQIMIQGKKPKSLPGATDDKVKIIRSGSRKS